mmetsp:Transcript_10676/g.11756  ORF Transcript_10676/g.11756 Transcript_10676/m.11756 type:complete len:96 (+) Transcript_10676:89-376(+)
MADEEQVFDFGTKKKKNKKEKKEKAEKDEDEGGQEGEVKLQGVSDWTPGPMKPYEDLLERLYKIISYTRPWSNVWKGLFGEPSRQICTCHRSRTP